MVGEITPAYGVIGIEGFRHMATLLPDARIIFLMRDPVDRLWSATRYFAANHPESQLMRSPESMVAFAMRPNNLAKSRYQVTIDHIAATFPDDHVLYGFYEEIFDSEAEQLSFLRRVCALLEIDYDRGRFADLAKVVNASPERPMPRRVRRCPQRRDGTRGRRGRAAAGAGAGSVAHPLTDVRHPSNQANPYGSRVTVSPSVPGPWTGRRSALRPSTVAVTGWPDRLATTSTVRCPSLRV